LHVQLTIGDPLIIVVVGVPKSLCGRAWRVGHHDGDAAPVRRRRRGSGRGRRRRTGRASPVIGPVSAAQVPARAADMSCEWFSLGCRSPRGH